MLSQVHFRYVYAEGISVPFELQKLGDDISASYHGILPLQEIPCMMQQVVDEVLAREPNARFAEILRQSQIVVSQVLDQTNTPFIDAISDRFFKAAAAPICTIFILERRNPPPVPEKSGNPSEEELKGWVEAVEKESTGQFSWEEFATTLSKTLHFSWQYKELSSKAKADLAKKLVSILVSQMQPPCPELIKVFADALIDVYFKPNATAVEEKSGPAARGL